MTNSEMEKYQDSFQFVVNSRYQTLGRSLTV